jgi:L-lysine 2,3-aminomutase
MNERVLSVFGVRPDGPEWHDWRWQYAHRIADARTLSLIVDLSAREKEEREGDGTKGRQ